MPPTPKANKPSNEALFTENEGSPTVARAAVAESAYKSGQSEQVKAIKEAVKNPLSETTEQITESPSLIDTYAIPILVELIRHELSRPKGGLGNHEALAAHAMRYARAAITERDRPFKPVTVAVAQGVPTQQPAAPVTVELPPPAPVAPNPLAPELPPGMSAATPEELRELMRG